MEQTNLGYSTKNIPIPDQKTYLCMLVSSLEEGLKRMRWRADIKLHPEKYQNQKQTFGFKTANSAPILAQLQDFNLGLQKIIKSIEFNSKTNPLQQKMKDDIRRIRNSDKILLEADKTTNYYKIDSNDHNTLLKNNITNEYKKSHSKIVENINKQDKKIADKFGVADRMFQIVKKEAHITFKDHKEDFRTTQSVD